MNAHKHEDNPTYPPHLDWEHRGEGGLLHAQAMTLFTLFLPLQYNDGTPIPSDQLDQIKQDILDRAGGLSQLSPGTGLWISSKRPAARDMVLPIQIVMDTSIETLAWLVDFTIQVAVILDQDKIFLVAQPALSIGQDIRPCTASGFSAQHLSKEDRDENAQ